MKLKSIISTLLALLTIAATCMGIVSCGNDSITDETTPAVTQAADSSEPAETQKSVDEWGREIVNDDIPADLKFSGSTLKILCRSDANWRWQIDFYAKEESGVKVNDAVYARNEAIKERLGIDIKITEKAGSYNEFSQYIQNVTKSVDGGSHDYDVVGTYSLYGAEYATKGYFRNINEVSQYINLDKVWWNKAIRDDLTIDNKLYLLVGDMNLTTLTRMLVTFFNKNMVKDGLSDVDLYSVVKDGKWTLEYMTGLIANTYVDSNGSGTADDDDVYGLISVSPSEAFDSFQASTDFHFLVRNNEGVWSVNENTDHLFDIVEKISELYYKGNNTSRFLSIQNNLVKFSSDTAYFMIMTLDKSGEEYLLNMKSEYGVLPLAKYNEEQKDYYTIPQDAFNFVSIVVDTENPDMVAAALELMSAGNYNKTTPVYFDDVLKYRYMSDSDSGLMLDLLREGLRFDFATINTLSVNDCGRWIRGVLSSGSIVSSKNLAASFKAIKKNTATAVDNLMKAYKALEK